MYQIQGIRMSSAFSLASSLNFTCVTPRAPRLLRPSKALNSTPIPIPFPTPHRPKYSIGAKLKPLGGFAVAALPINNKDKRIGVAFASADSKPMAVQKSENEWRALLSPQQFRILRQKATELPGTGEYNKFYGDGTYKCAGCGTPLYKSTSKFDSGCGWPAFFEGLPGAIKRTPDADGRRIEITCAACGGHLGHVFKGEGFPTPTDERHCVNSISMKFTPANE